MNITKQITDFLLTTVAFIAIWVFLSIQAPRYEATKIKGTKLQKQSYKQESNKISFNRISALGKN